MTNRVGSEKKPGSSDGLKLVEKDQQIANEQI